MTELPLAGRLRSRILAHEQQLDRLRGIATHESAHQVLARARMNLDDALVGMTAADLNVETIDTISHSMTVAARLMKAVEDAVAAHGPDAAVDVGKASDGRRA